MRSRKLAAAYRHSIENCRITACASECSKMYRSDGNPNEGSRPRCSRQRRCAPKNCASSDLPFANQAATPSRKASRKALHLARLRQVPIPSDRGGVPPILRVPRGTARGTCPAVLECRPRCPGSNLPIIARQTRTGASCGILPSDRLLGSDQIRTVSGRHR